MNKQRPFQARRSFSPEWWAKTFSVTSAEHTAIEGTVERLTGRPARAERRIAAFITKNRIAGEQDWKSPWISFRAIAQYCTNLRTPRKAAAGEAGTKFAYRELVHAVARGEFSTGGRCRVLLLVSHGGKVLSITPGELLEAQEKFDPQVFETGYLNNCWTYVGLVAQWFRSRRVPPPWHSETRPVLHIPRGRHFGSIDHGTDVAVIDLALKMQAGHKIRDRAAVRGAISKAHIPDKTGSVADRLRTRLRKRRKLRRENAS